MNKKYYWLKLDKNFLKRKDIKNIELMENGKDYILFYLKLLYEIDLHKDVLSFNEIIPYSQEMLRTITNTSIDVIRCAINTFTEMKMMEILDEQTIFMHEVNKVLRNNDKYEVEDKDIEITNEFELQFENKKLKFVDEKELMFDEFWQKYPRKVNKKGAKTSFMRIKGLKNEFDKIMFKLDLFINSKQWKQNDGQFIPHPQTWINQKRWEDETNEEQKRSEIAEWLNS